VNDEPAAAPPATPQDVISKLDQAVAQFIEITSVPKRLAAAHGHDPTKWPPGHAQNVGKLLAEARAEVAQLTTKKLVAEFKHSP
jgi:hypothetical protein